MEKRFDLSGTGPGGFPLIHLVEPGSAYGLNQTAGLTKTASGEHLSPVIELLEAIQPQPDRLYLVNSALGAGEYVGFNLRGDWFTEAGLKHTPPGWDSIPVWDIDARRRAAIVPEDVPGYGPMCWGYPTFYNAHRFRHHRNNDPNRAYGYILGAFYDDRMHRVVLVSELIKDLCVKHGALNIYERIARGDFVDTSMGCFPAGAMVSLYSGERKAIETVEVGEYVLTHTGSRGRVRALDSHVHEGLYTIKVSGVGSMEVTEEHPFFVIPVEQIRCEVPKTHNYGRQQRACVSSLKDLKKGCQGCPVEPAYDPVWKKAQDLDVGDFALSPAPSEVVERLTAKQARILGYYASEGNICWYYPKKGGKRQLDRKYPGGVCFTINHDEVDLLEDIEELCCALDLPEPSVAWREGTSTFSIAVYQRKFAEFCLAMCGKYSLAKRLAPELMLAPPDVQKEFLGAYLNGDGGCLRGQAYISTGNEQLAYQLQMMMIRCGIATSLNVINHKGTTSSLTDKDTVEYQIWLGVLGGYRLQDYSSHPLRKPKKVLSQRWTWVGPDGTPYVASPVVEASYDPEWVGEVYNFSVDDDESYCISGVAVHNSRVPDDECSICGHLARTPAQYCRHVQRGAVAPYGMGKLLADGRRCGVYNHHPLFFDDSFVFIGAERSAKVMDNVTPLLRGTRTYTSQVYIPPRRMRRRRVASADSKAASLLGQETGDEQREKDVELGQALVRAANPPAMGAHTGSLGDKISKLLSVIPTLNEKQDMALQHVTERMRRQEAIREGSMEKSELQFWEQRQLHQLRQKGVSKEDVSQMQAVVQRQMRFAFGGPRRGALKKASLMHAKWAEHLKRIPVPSQSQLALVAEHAARLPQLPPSLLDFISEDLKPRCSVLAEMGVVLQPEEFAYAAAPSMLEGLTTTRRAAFLNTPLPPAPICPSYTPMPRPGIAGICRRTRRRILSKDLLGLRSLAPRHVGLRLVMARPRRQIRSDVLPPEDVTLKRASLLYNDYRLGLLAQPPAWSYGFDRPGEKVSSVEELSSLLLRLAHWPSFPIG